MSIQEFRPEYRPAEQKTYKLNFNPFAMPLVGDLPTGSMYFYAFRFKRTGVFLLDEAGIEVDASTVENLRQLPIGGLA